MYFTRIPNVNNLFLDLSVPLKYFQKKKKKKNLEAKELDQKHAQKIPKICVIIT